MICGWKGAPIIFREYSALWNEQLPLIDGFCYDKILFQEGGSSYEGQGMVEGFTFAPAQNWSKRYRRRTRWFRCRFCISSENLRVLSESDLQAIATVNAEKAGYWKLWLSMKTRPSLVIDSDSISFRVTVIKTVIKKLCLKCKEI